MPSIIVLPHHELCPNGTVIQAEPGETICDAALRQGLAIEHACEKSCACTTCHVVVREGFDSLNELDELEEDMLDKAWGLEADSRLSCQAVVADEDLVIEIPRYTLNHASENTEDTHMRLTWTDSLEIALALIDAHPEVDPKTVRFTDLREWVMALPEFEDDPAHCGERVLEAIQLAWMEEV